MRDAGALIKARLGAVKCGVVTDENVARHHLATLEESLKAEGLFAGSIVMKPGEATKSFRDLATLSERLLELGLERGDLVVPFGGGVIGDLAGFAAGILRRGIRFVQIPTSLLAQVDSSVGGKTGINTPQGKNLIGVFHQPSLVIADTDGADDAAAARDARRLCRSCQIRPARRRAFFAWLEANWQGVFGNNGPALTQGDRDECRRPRRRSWRATRRRPASGRCSTSAIRSATRSKPGRGYSDRLLHGEGVAIGMCLAFRLSEELGICPPGRRRPRGSTFESRRPADQNRRHSRETGRPRRGSRLMGQDKKVRSGKLTFILVRDIGEAFVSRDVAPETVRAFLGRRNRRV